MNRPEKNIAFFGGSFNPPTVAHQEIMAACLDEPHIDEVWVAPSGERRDKMIGNSIMSRVAMLELVKSEVFNNNPRLIISDFEQKLPPPTHTSQTSRALDQRFPDCKFWFVYGADTYASMPNWKNGAQLQQDLPLLLAPRGDCLLPMEDERIKHLQINEHGVVVSSSLVREAVRGGASIDGLVCSGVQRYVESQRLYGGVGESGASVS